MVSWQRKSVRLAKLMCFIAMMEGYFHQGTIPARCHNPGALVFVGQEGARPGPRGYACFDSDEVGWAALKRLLEGKLRRKGSLQKAWPYLKDR
jgi:hypothetical protein